MPTPGACIVLAVLLTFSALIRAGEPKAEPVSLGKIYSTAGEPQKCNPHNCVDDGGYGYIIYGAEMIDNVCRCKMTTWSVVKGAAELGADLEKRIVALEKKVACLSWNKCYDME